MRCKRAVAREPADFVATDSVDVTGIERGLGDIITRLTDLVTPPVGSWLPSVEASASLKIPTADGDESLGTGGFDVTLEVALSRRFGDLTPFGAVGYRWVGDSPSDDLQDRWLSSCGVAYHASEGLRLGLTYAWRDLAGTPPRRGPQR